MWLNGSAPQMYPRKGVLAYTFKMLENIEFLFRKENRVPVATSCCLSNKVMFSQHQDRVL